MMVSVIQKTDFMKWSATNAVKTLSSRPALAFIIHRKKLIALTVSRTIRSLSLIIRPSGRIGLGARIAIMNLRGTFLHYLQPPTDESEKLAMTEEQIKYMVYKFLGWRLPQPWNPDNGISYKRPNYAHAPAEHDWPTGTNLFDYSQAEAMVRHMIEGLTSEEVIDDKK